jgi:predicted Holliday junction resolvase-like endonuclease
MSQEDTGKARRSFEEDNANSMNALTAELAKVKEEKKVLEEKLREAEQNARIAKNEVRNIHTYVTARMGNRLVPVLFGPKWEINRERTKNKNLKKM